MFISRNAIVVTCVVLLSISSTIASAQNTSSNCWAYFYAAVYADNGGWGRVLIPQVPSTAYDCASSGPWSLVCKVKTTKCAPAPECPACNKGGAPIDFATGDTYIAQTDIRVPGLGGGLTLSRTWNSIPFESISAMGMFGPNWTSNFEENVFVGGDGFMKYLRGDGGIWSFGFVSSGGNTVTYAVVGPASNSAGLTQNGNTNWTLVFPNGETRVFDFASGKLLSIADRNGNTTQLSYDASYRLVTVTDPASRHLYFSYAGPTSYLVTGVTSDFGVSLSYTYYALGRLAQVTKADKTTVSFQYNDRNPTLITAVLDSNGKVLESHTYDSVGRGLTSSRAGGVEAVTITYPR